MRKVLIVSLIFLSNISFSQSIWKLNEHKPNGKKYALDSTLNFHNIDISSRVFLEFNKDNIRKELSSLSDQEAETNRLINKVILLNEISKKGLKALPIYSEGIIEYNQARTLEKKTQILDSIGNVISGLSLELISVSEKDQELRTLLNEAFFDATKDGNYSWSNIYLKLFQTSQTYASTLRFELDQLLKNEGVYIQMAATLHSVRNNEKQSIHIEGFDSFEPPEYYDPYELNLTLNEKQLAEIKNLQTSCDSINKVGLSNVINGFVDKFDSDIITPLINELNASLTDLLNQTEEILLQDIPVKELEQRIKSLRNEIIIILPELKTLYVKYTTMDLAINMETVKLISKDVKKLSGSLSPILSDSKEIVRIIQEKKDILPNNVKRAIDNFQSSLEEIALSKIQQGYEVVNQLYSEITGYRTISEINKLSAEFSDKVHKLDLKDIPSSTILDIKNNTGYREEGDDVVLEMRGGKKDGDPKTLKKEYFTLIKTQPHFVTNVGIAFVKQDGGDQNFSAVVSSNTLFKFGTRGKGTFYRKFIDVGLGINVSTLNFNTDNPFEFGAAPVVSIFNDYLVSGYGYNFTQGDWYLLISIRVPFLMKEINL